MITLTDKAAKKLKETMKDWRGLRVGVKAAGCSGMQYVLEWAAYKNLEDAEFTDKGVPLLVDQKSLVYVDGAVIDHVKRGLNEGFEFSNPNSKAECGCGESFIV
ncbi:MAG: iron-sulfur cluster assembly protein IscA [Gammaproteobacteria bacterium]|nr:iron-sulfur cluster assembly protein IscA [Gammaproteobacteria bacterium]|tara:strand:+ start:1808 stop:2119 length:312 start_codon:yes stop_codon:yes gene_type:complete